MDQQEHVPFTKIDNFILIGNYVGGGKEGEERQEEERQEEEIKVEREVEMEMETSHDVLETPIQPSVATIDITAMDITGTTPTVYPPAPPQQSFNEPTKQQNILVDEIVENILAESKHKSPSWSWTCCCCCVR